MNIDHPDLQIGGRRYGLRDSVGDVMKFEIKKDVKAKITQRAHHIGPRVRKQLLPHFESNLLWVQFPGQINGALSRRIVERDDEFATLIRHQPRPPHCRDNDLNPNVDSPDISSAAALQ